MKLLASALPSLGCDAVWEVNQWIKDLSLPFSAALPFK